MKKVWLWLVTALSLLGMSTTAQANSKTMTVDPENTLLMETTMGPVVIQLLPDLAPAHVERLKTLAREGFYDGIKFHRVIPNFMAQTGDPLSKSAQPAAWGTGSSELPNLPAEFSDAPFRRGTVGMARSQNPNSANSQFFICFGETAHLNGQYTVFGQVIEGMKFVDALAPGQPPKAPDEIITLRVMSDVQ